ncbi:nucleotidyl transferase AbiEii/AbiGii toxin family protein [Thermus sp.]|uniref:nucleotidyl transferase AbiEii/AbiGii toxin family protein n=1 Tax=Thermus sp. TaxID=275 RepID=UPI003D105AB7
MTIERFLARLYAKGASPFVVVGAFALSTLLGRRRTTQDLDLEAWESIPDPLELLREAAHRDLGDGFVFRVQERQRDRTSGVRRFTLAARLGGRLFEEVALDVHVSGSVGLDPVRARFGPTVELEGLEPPEVPLAPLAWQYANKLHAYLRERASGQNTRVKDLVDLAILTIELAEEANPQMLARAVERAYAIHGGRPRLDFPDPPAAWRREFRAMAREAGLEPPEMDLWTKKVRAHYETVLTLLNG